ncbi:MAG: ribosomal protein S18 acetylase RimI-like enzyme, partial [Planctomycetota bacterium]
MIRQLQAGDAVGYRRIRLEGLLHDPLAFTMVYGEWRDRPLADFAERLEKLEMFAALEGDRIVGTIALEADYLDPNAGWIIEVYVTRDFRGKGISDKLMQHVVSLHTYLELRLETASGNTHARALYTRHGFQDRQRSQQEQQ